MVSKISQPIYLFLFFLVFITRSGGLPSFETCRKIDSCTCEMSNGATIDLHFSAHSVDGVPVFHYQSTSLSDNFKYSPCKGLPCGKDPTDASLCIDDISAVELGTISSARFLIAGENITLVYKSNDSEKNVTSQVRLQCSHTKEQFVLEENTSTTYDFTLYSRCACPGLCGQSAPSGELSAGTILVLIFFSALILYFGIGCLYRKAIYGAENCAEMVPHGTFWLSLPSLIKDGYLFFISPCIGNRAEYRTYDKL